MQRGNVDHTRRNPDGARERLSPYWTAMRAKLAEKTYTRGATKAAAIKCDITGPYISELIYGRCLPSLVVFILLCRALDTSPNDMLDWDKVIIDDE